MNNIKILIVNILGVLYKQEISIKVLINIR